MMMLALAIVIMALATIGVIRQLGRPAATDHQSTLFHTPPAPAAMAPPPSPALPPEPDVNAQIGRVVSEGMDRVEAMRLFGADRFMTFLPMPDGTCWSLVVVRHADERAAKGYYQPVPAVTH